MVSRPPLIFQSLQGQYENQLDLLNWTYEQCPGSDLQTKGSTGDEAFFQSIGDIPRSPFEVGEK